MFFTPGDFAAKDAFKQFHIDRNNTTQEISSSAHRK